jgi:AcrR family transcriptional regulator
MTAPRAGGRPSRAEAERIGEQILAVATEMFLAQGYGATSIEAIAQRLRISKRTFYHRFNDKAALFEAVVRGIVGRLRPAEFSQLFTGGSVEEILLRLGNLALKAAVAPQGIALQRLIIAEVTRFPELAAIAAGEGTRHAAVTAIARLLMQALPPPSLPEEEARFAAEQFLQMIITLPQRSAMGLGPKMSEEDHRLWVRRTVTLFLQGCMRGGQRP